MLEVQEILCVLSDEFFVIVILDFFWNEECSEEGMEIVNKVC